MTKYILTTLLVFSFLIRIINLGANPIILNRDEAALAYNAVLLKETGQDEWGESWPLTLQSFGDYKLIGYPLLLVGLFHWLPTEDWVVRLPSAIAGVGIIGAIYLLTKRFTKQEATALLTAGLASITPILFFYSRIAFEANVALCYWLYFIYCVVRPVDKLTWRFDLLGLCLVIAAVLTYNTPLLLLPFILILVPFIRGLKRVRNWSILVGGGSIIFICFLLAYATLTSQKQAITIFSDPTVNHYYVQYRNQFSGLALQTIGSKYVYAIFEIIPRFIESFSIGFLVVQGGAHPWHQMPGWGHILLTQYLLAAIGVGLGLYQLMQHKLQLIKAKGIKSAAVFWQAAQQPLLSTWIGKTVCLAYLVIVSLAPSVVTVDSPHATRSLFFIVLLVLSGGYGLSRLKLKATYLSLATTIIIVGSVSLFAKYVRSYIYEYPTLQVQILKAGFNTTIARATEQYPNQQLAIVDPDGYQYILAAWYLQLSPAQFRATIHMQDPDRIGFRYGDYVGNLHFIKEAADRSQQEPIVVEWNAETNTWDVHES